MEFTEELAAGVIYLPGDVPQTSEGILSFLSGSEEHEAVEPDVEDEDGLAGPVGRGTP